MKILLFISLLLVSLASYAASKEDINDTERAWRIVLQKTRDQIVHAPTIANPENGPILRKGSLPSKVQPK